MYFNSNGMPSLEKGIGWEESKKLLAPTPLTKDRSPGKIFIRTVKLTGIILLIACLQVSARTNAQLVNISLKNSSLEKLFKEIEKNTNYVFIYDVAILKTGKPVNVEMRQVSVEEVLRASLKDQELDYLIANNTIFIKRKREQNGGKNISDLTDGGTPVLPEVNGSVTDENGEPLAGASIKLKGGKVVAISDERGYFKLKNVNGDATLELSFTGFAETDIAIGGKSVLKISLKHANNKLDEVQIIAYGTTSQRLSTGDVTTVTSKEIEEQPVSNPLAALEGRVPGLVINQTSGVPGGAFTVQIRGQNSLANGNDPFYVIDGVPYSSQTVGLINNNLSGNHNLIGYNYSSGNPLNYINPSDIESISILKDADATSIYGSRAANGAILITTKRGKVGASKVELNLYSGVGQVTKMMNLLNTKEYLTMRNEAFDNDGTVPGAGDHDVNGDWDTTRYTNWQKLLIGNTAHYDDAQASVSGGSENIQYLVGGGYHGETTVFPGTTADQKASVHININSTSLNKKFRTTLTAGYTADMSNVPILDLTLSALTLSPDAPAVYNKDGTLNWAPLSPGQVGTWSNPIANLSYGYKGRTNNLVSNFLITYTLLPGLNISTSLGYTRTQTNEIIVAPTTTLDPGYDVTSGNSQFNNTSTGSWIVEPQATYSLALGKGKLTALLGSTFEENTSDGQDFYASGFSSDVLLQDIQAASSVQVRSALNTAYKYNALFGRLNYNWDERYIINLSARRDGSSRFGPGDQFANFGSAGVGWIFSKETFSQHILPFLSFGKLRASYGSSGNDQIGDYRFLDLYNLTQYPYQGSQGLYPTNLSNPDLAWEFDKKLEGAISLGFLKDRITINASYYLNRSSNQLVTEPLSAVTGFSLVAVNLPALVQNSGLELTFNTVNIKSLNFRWNSSFNLTLPRNKLVSFPNLATSSYSNFYVIGKPITITKLYRFNGVNDSSGIYQFIDSKGDNTSSPNYPIDATAYVDRAPVFYGGLENSFSYKGFQLDILFQFVKQTGQNIFDFSNNPPGFISNVPTVVLNRWQKPGDMKPYQQFTESSSSNAYNTYGYYSASSDAAYTEASFIRLKNLAFSYSLPKTLIQRIRLKDCRIYLHGQNLLTITKYLGLDPETQANVLPPLRVWAAGIQVDM
jgi:TonB-dependent starch-binding outer membrane protein SusC